MKKSMRYEMVLVLDPDLDDAGVKGEIEKIRLVVSNHAGALEAEDIWGRRPLSYPMKKKSAGTVVILTLSGDNTLVAELTRQLRINDQVLRFSAVKKDKYAPDFRQVSDDSIVLPELNDADGDSLDG